jgi:hypothetical protein
MAESANFTLLPPVPAERYLPPAGLPWWAWALAGLALAILLAIVVVRRRSPRTTPAGPDLAVLRRRALDSLATIDPAAGPAVVATAVSLVVRRFLADLLDDPALFETHEEFLARDHPLARLPDDQRTATSTHFATLARMKYAPAEPADTTAAIAGARHLLAQLSPLPPPTAPPPLPGSMPAASKFQLAP